MTWLILFLTIDLDMFELIRKSFNFMVQWVIIGCQGVLKGVNFNCKTINLWSNLVNLVSQSILFFNHHLIGNDCSRPNRSWWRIVFTLVDILRSIPLRTYFLNNTTINQIIKPIHLQNPFSSHNCMTLFKNLDYFPCIWKTFYLKTRCKHVIFDHIWLVNNNIMLKCTQKFNFKLSQLRIVGFLRSNDIS